MRSSGTSAENIVAVEEVPEERIDQYGVVGVGERNDVRRRRKAASGVHHLRQAAALVLNQHVRQQQRERLAADQFARAPHGVAEAERLLLPGEARRTRRRQLLAQEFERAVLLALEQRHLQLELAVEVILDDALVAAGDKDEMLDR